MQNIKVLGHAKWFHVESKYICTPIHTIISFNLILILNSTSPPPHTHPSNSTEKFMFEVFQQICCRFDRLWDIRGSKSTNTHNLTPPQFCDRNYVVNQYSVCRRNDFRAIYFLYFTDTFWMYNTMNPHTEKKVGVDLWDHITCYQMSVQDVKKGACFILNLLYVNRLLFICFWWFLK